MRILVVEDDSDLGPLLCDALEAESYAVDLATRGADADELAAINEYDLVVLDWNIPAPNGLTLLKGWREEGRQVPVLMLTGQSGVDDRVDGLDAGADDYLTKPFSMVELLARTRSLMRRRDRVLTPLRAADLELDRTTRRVTIAGEEIDMPPKEFGVLEYLLRHVNEPVSRTDIAEHVWDESFDAMSNVIDVILYRLRKKIDGQRDRKLLHTLKGVGYVLRSERR
jgi:two-component system copper resistance phosphate regulon response regulator CusR